MKTIIALFILVLATAQAAENNYYPQFFIDEIGGSVSNDALKAEINKVLTSTHQKDAKGGRDTLGCANVGSNGCYEHVVLGYNGARKVLFGSLHIEKINGQTAIRDVYCHKIFSASAGVKPGAIPNSNQLNCEHTWPQSKFSRLYPNEMQKSDLHHLFPTDSRANSIRGNYDFSDISSDNGELEQTNCGISKFGTSATSSDGETFEPPMEHKGNVARALFYFSVKYKISIPKDEESTLRRWNDLDPVDDAERTRNDAIAAAQGTRNPFIDFPQLVNYINRF